MTHTRASSPRKDPERASSSGTQLEKSPSKNGENHPSPTIGPTAVDEGDTGPTTVDEEANGSTTVEEGAIGPKAVDQEVAAPTSVDGVTAGPATFDGEATSAGRDWRFKTELERIEHLKEAVEALEDTVRSLGNNKDQVSAWSQSVDKKIEALLKQVDALHPNSLRAPPSAPPGPPPGPKAWLEDDPKYTQLRNIMSEHYRTITGLQHVVAHLQLVLQQPPMVPSGILQAMQDTELGVKNLEEFRDYVRPTIHRQETNIVTCGRNIKFIIDTQDTRARKQEEEFQNLQAKFVALQAAVNQEVVVTPHRGPPRSTPGTPHVTPQKVVSPGSPTDLQTARQIPASGPVDEVVEEGPAGILLKTMGQRLKTLERYHEDYIRREAKGDILSIASTSTSEKLLNTLEEQPLESLGHQLLLTLGQQLMATIKQQVLEALQQHPEILVKQDSSFPEQHGSLEQRLFENLKQQLLATMEQRFSNIPQRLIVKGLEQQLFDSLRLQLEKKFEPRFEKLDSQVKEKADATRQLVKSKMSGLEGRMLPSLDDKNERIIDLEVSQKSMELMLEKLGEQVNKLAERNETLEQRNESLKRKVETLEEVIDATDIECPESVSDKAASPESEGRSSKRKRLEKRTEAPKTPEKQNPTALSQASGSPRVEIKTKTKRKRKSTNNDILSMPIHFRNPNASLRNDLMSIFRPELRIPKSVQDHVADTILHAETAYNGRAPVTDVGGINRCLRTPILSKTEWPRGQTEEAACMHCTMDGYACLLATKQRYFVLLPLAKELREGFEISEKGYWISEHGKNFDYGLLWDGSKLDEVL